MEPFIIMSDKIEHNLIDLCYIKILFLCPFLCYVIPGFPIMPAHENRLIFKMAVILTTNNYCSAGGQLTKTNAR